MCQLMSCLFPWRPASLHSQHEAELFILQPEHLNICLAVIWLLVQEFASQLPQLGVILDYDSSSTSPEDAKAIQQLRSSGHVVTISSRTRGQHLASPAGYQPPHLVSPTWPFMLVNGITPLVTASLHSAAAGNLQLQQIASGMTACCAGEGTAAFEFQLVHDQAYLPAQTQACPV